MALNAHVPIVMKPPQNQTPDEDVAHPEAQVLEAKGKQLAAELAWVPRITSSRTFANRCDQLGRKIGPVMAVAEASKPPLPDDIRCLRENQNLVCSELIILSSDLRLRAKLPHVHTPQNNVVPRVLAFVRGYVAETGSHFSEQTFNAYCHGFQQHTPFELREFKALPSALKLALLEEIAARAERLRSRHEIEPQNLGICMQSLREASQVFWKEALEPLILFDHVLRQDPVACYGEMEFDARDLYRDKIAELAARSDLTEIQVAQEALALAQEAHSRIYPDPRIHCRESHIGYYLAAEGKDLLADRIGHRPTFLYRLRRWLRAHPDEFFVPGITLFTCLIMTAVMLIVTPSDSSLGLILLSLLLLLLPSSQCAVQLMDYVITALLRPEILPKLDYSKGVPDGCMTLVAVPTLLLSEKQVRGLVDNLEVRFLGNHDPNIHFALVSDLADAQHQTREDSSLIDLCSNLIRELNEKYAGDHRGSFFLLHRHRIYNPREKRWMGWERKRGKLLDLNRLLRGQFDSFPVKVGDLSILPKVRFIITLDSDTELPRGTAHRMIGAMAHPLNQAIIDPLKNIVVAGYGILQPRVGVSVQSTVRSRLAAIYAGETGLDIYTRAISDAYQDLYGEGIFTGKGIYELDTVHRVLDARFPTNSLLSHDLIEGAYARVGLATDMEVIEDYPSHYSAYNRRKHRWLRGDWQIAGWLFSAVPNQSGQRVPNPISLVSRWKILDNLRRSLVEPATFVLFLFAWLMPGIWALGWTIAALVLLFLPAWFELGFAMGRATAEQKRSVAGEAVRAFLTTNFTTFLTLVFLAHQTLLSLDAVVRASVRRTFTRERLLEWETAAEAELNTSLTPVDRYLNWMPVLALAIGVLVWLVRPRSLPVALPILILWACSKLVSAWLNRSPVVPRKELARKDLLLLRRSALHTWRYFVQHCNEEQNWLIPDNVQEEPPAIAARVSPTNLGMLLNSQQVACELGYMTVPELAQQTQRTLGTLKRLPKYQGHLLNWYDTLTLKPLPHQFVSAVDSGNLVASLWTLQQGLLDCLYQPLLRRSLAEGILDHFRALARCRAYPRGWLSRLEKSVKSQDWISCALNLNMSTPQEVEARKKSRHAEQIAWFGEQSRLRLQQFRELACSYAPWQLLEFSAIRANADLSSLFKKETPLGQMPEFIEDLQKRLERAQLSAPDEQQPAYEKLLRMLPEAHANAIHLAESLRITAAEAGKLADAMDFAFLLNRKRKLLSVGFNLQTQKLESACYDLLASEARMAAFIAVAKEDVAQECWFRMGRPHTLARGQPVLISWSGTMFEYLMPTMWLRTFPNTLLARSRGPVVSCQREYAMRKGIPWGISESSYAKLDESGNYHYQAFGIPQLSIMKYESDPMVIAPYATFLALNVNSAEALRNLRRLDRLGAFGACGFYEAADFSPERTRRGHCQIVHQWMAHHQGMTLLALANFLCDDVVQRWFHSSRRVQATELLLHEKPVSHVSRMRLAGLSAA
jgi:cyclic beta-1,2-glucan synthetase